MIQELDGQVLNRSAFDDRSAFAEIAGKRTPVFSHCGPVLFRQCGVRICGAGYSGNGFSCVDINECEQNNGGCSMNPFVQCVNTPGSRACQPCPDGKPPRTCYVTQIRLTAEHFRVTDPLFWVWQDISVFRVFRCWSTIVITILKRAFEKNPHLKGVFHCAENRDWNLDWNRDWNRQTWCSTVQKIVIEN